ncbi:MAG: hypothetical protein RLZZ01_327 [Actinomycetota bacterium]|jgi:hypothetical protein
MNTTTNTTTNTAPLPSLRIAGRPRIDPIGWDRRIRDVRFVCPGCGDECSGGLFTEPDGGTRVECDGCARRYHPDVLDVPTTEVLGQWYAQAVRQARCALRDATGRSDEPDEAVAWCRRLAPELSRSGKTKFLDAVIRPLLGRITDRHRCTLVDLGAALGMSAGDINRFLLSV